MSSTLEWNVMYHNFNAKRIEKWNVFNHYGFLEDCKKYARKYGNDRQMFLDNVRKSLMYYYWAKCEWEVIVQGWPPACKDVELKIDVYDQVMLNWDKFCEYIWSKIPELRRRERKRG